MSEPSSPVSPLLDAIDSHDTLAEYRHCTQLALQGDRNLAADRLVQLLSSVKANSFQARIHNDLAVIASMDGRLADAQQEFDRAVKLAPDWLVPQENRRRLLQGMESVPIPAAASRQTRVAIVSLLFNWPSTGGGTVHTAETGKFLTQAGYQVRHFFAEYAEWGLGNVTEPPLSPSEAIRFTPDCWNVPEIQSRFRKALQAFQPDWVIVTDSWNSKPILAEAARDFPYFLRIAAQECLCPLNNVRLLFDQNKFHSCPKHQLATPAECCQCVHHNGRFSGGLHQAERELVNYGTPEYDRTLRSAFANAEAVLVVNPLIGAMISPYARHIQVVPSGFDPARFPSQHTANPRDAGTPLRILFAGLVNEPMKGFEVIAAACDRLWNVRQDFELLATADPPGPVNPFTRYVGWHSQAALPTLMHDSDILVFPTVAEEALGRTAVEAMGASRPVVASRIGGLQFTVVDGATGLLFEPGNVEDLCRKLQRLLDDSDLRDRLGRAGRERFEEHYTWDSILAKHYVPLLGASSRKL